MKLEGFEAPTMAEWRDPPSSSSYAARKDHKYVLRNMAMAQRNVNVGSKPSINTNTQAWSAAVLGPRQVISNIYLQSLSSWVTMGYNQNCKHPHLPTQYQASQSARTTHHAMCLIGQCSSYWRAQRVKQWVGHRAIPPSRSPASPREPTGIPASL